MFVFENVPGMVSANKGAAYEAIQEDFINEGYELVYNDVLNLAHIGVPQARKRLIIIGVKKSLNLNLKKVTAIIDKYLKNKLLEKYPLKTTFSRLNATGFTYLPISSSSEIISSGAYSYF